MAIAATATPRWTPGRPARTPDRVNLADVSVLAANYNRQGASAVAEPAQQPDSIRVPSRIDMAIVPLANVVSSGQLVEVEYRLLVTDGGVNVASFVGGYDPARLAVVAVSCDESPLRDYQTCSAGDE